MGEHRPVVGVVWPSGHLLVGDRESERGAHARGLLGLQRVEPARGPDQQCEAPETEAERRLGPGRPGLCHRCDEARERPDPAGHTRRLPVEETSGHAIPEGIGLGSGA